MYEEWTVSILILKGTQICNSTFFLFLTCIREEKLNSNDKDTQVRPLGTRHTTSLETPTHPGFYGRSGINEKGT